MKTVKVIVLARETTIEVEDDATDGQIEEAARDAVIYELLDWDWKILSEDG